MAFRGTRAGAFSWPGMIGPSMGSAGAGASGVPASWSALNSVRSHWLWGLIMGLFLFWFCEVVRVAVDCPGVVTHPDLHLTGLGDEAVYESHLVGLGHFDRDAVTAPNEPGCGALIALAEVSGKDDGLSELQPVGANSSG